MMHVFSYLLYCNHSIFYFLWILPALPLWILPAPHPIKQPFFEIKIFWPTTTAFLLKVSSPQFKRQGHMLWHYQISWLSNKVYQKFIYVYQKTYLKDFRLRIIGNKKVLGKSHNRNSAQSLFYKYIFGNSSQKLHISRF